MRTRLLGFAFGAVLVDDEGLDLDEERAREGRPLGCVDPADEPARIERHEQKVVAPPQDARRRSRISEADAESPSASPLGQGRGRARKRGIERSEGPFRRLVQVLVVERDTAFVSAAPFPRGPALTAWPARFPGGRAEVPVCDAPSSAYKKLDEALAWLEEGPKEGDVVLDLVLTGERRARTCSRHASSTSRPPGSRWASASRQAVMSGSAGVGIGYARGTRIPCLAHPGRIRRNHRGRVVT